jgi:putative ABC transport system permease protein
MRALSNAFFLAWHYLQSSRFRTAVLVFCTSLCFFLPSFTFVAASRIEGELSARGDSSPVLIGYKGNEFDLTMSSLYFRGTVDDTVPYALVAGIRDAGYGTAIPLFVRFTALGIPIVGTSLSYFERRGLAVAEGGRLPGMLGEVVVGSEVAAQYGIEVGDKRMSDHTNLYNIADAYPLVLHVVGVFEPTGTIDDHAIFADVKTTWVLQGMFHGHAQVEEKDALNAGQEDENLEASAALFIFNEITADNLGTYHVHGDLGDAPLSAVLVFPTDHRALSQLLGDYALSETHQALQPSTVIDTILDIVMRVRAAVQAYFGLILLSTGAFFVLVMVLSLRLRAAEIALAQRIGCSRGAIAAIVGAEVALIVVASLMMATALTGVGLAVLDRMLAL